MKIEPSEAESERGPIFLDKKPESSFIDDAYFAFSLSCTIRET